MAEIDATRLLEQEEIFARAYDARDPARARDLYRPDVVYVSPTVRLYDRPAEIVGLDATLEFIQLTLQNVSNVRYRCVEHAVGSDGSSAFVRIHFDFDAGRARLRSDYVVIYRYRGGRIARQELYYDPSGRLERLDRPPPG